MQQIISNPYRTLGILVGATAREQERQVRRLKQLIEAEQEIPEDFSFPVLGDIKRSVNGISEASNKLNLNADRASAALFWFYNGSHTDEPVFDSMKGSKEDAQEAINVWMKLVDTGEVTKRNASAHQNLSNVLLNAAFKNGTINTAQLEKAINLKLRFLESEFLNDFVQLATDENFKISKNELEKYFLSQVFDEVNKRGGISAEKYLEIINNQYFAAKEDFLMSFIKKPISELEKKVEAAKAERKATPANANKVGEKLYNETKESLSQLKSILGTNDLNYTNISDKVADAVLQCGIDYFKHYRDSSSDPSQAALELFRKAQSLAIGNIVKQRCEENSENLREWIEDKPEREKQSKVLADLEKIKNLIDEYESKSETVSNAKQLIIAASAPLNRIKATLGSTDELYLGLSSRVASDAQGLMVSEINKLQERFSNTYDNATKIAALMLLKERTNEAWEVTSMIGNMDLRSDFRTRYTANRNSLSNLKTQLSSVGTSTGKSSSSSGGCYVATMAYGDYDHPQVMILRSFRDNNLKKSKAGREFIRVYYKYSPLLVEKLKNHKLINSIIRGLLDLFIKIIK